MRNVPVYSISEISKIIQFPVDEVERALFYPDFPKHILINDETMFDILYDFKKELLRHIRENDTTAQETVYKLLDVAESIVDAFNGKLPREFFIEK